MAPPRWQAPSPQRLRRSLGPVHTGQESTRGRAADAGDRGVRVFATYNIKGGVGKTTTAVNLAYLAARDGQRTLLWDLDPQGAASYLFRIRPRVKGGAKALIRGARSLDDGVKGTDFDNLDLLPADFTYRNMDLELDATKNSTRRLRRLLKPLSDEYDVIFLD